jgi:hypothetical protein
LGEERKERNRDRQREREREKWPWAFLPRAEHALLTVPGRIFAAVRCN